MSDRLQGELQQLLSVQLDPLIAALLIRTWPTASGPALVICLESQQERYVVKGPQLGRSVIVDHLVAQLGMKLGAPVGEPFILEISPDLIDMNHELAHFAPGLAHGTLFIENCVDDRDLRKYSNIPENRERFALLALLYGWCEAQDHQFLFTMTSPSRVYSVDHGFFLAGAKIGGIIEAASSEPAQFDRLIDGWCKFTAVEKRWALSKLSEVEESMILAAVASPPEAWGITMAERVDLAQYLLARQKALLDLFD